MEIDPMILLSLLHDKQEEVLSLRAEILNLRAAAQSPTAATTAPQE
jgi:hypothetical protein